MNTYNATRSAVIRSFGLLGIKVAAFLLTGSAVLMAALIDSMVDVIASLIAHLIKPKEHHEEHQLSLIQAMWIVAGGIIVLLESIRGFNEPVDMAFVGIGILILTLVVDFSIVKKLSQDTNPVVVGLAEDIKADMTNAVGGLAALSLIAVGMPMQTDKVIAIIISVVLMVKGVKLFFNNLVEASIDHDLEDLDNTEGVGLTSANA
jgi:ferrous-iron efflux pump FieF